MFCINCGDLKTKVINSRPSKKEASIWRRRNCVNCGQTFTTREEVVLEDQVSLSHSDGANAPFSLPRLSVYLSRLLIHRGDQAPEEAFWLAKTIRTNLYTPSRASEYENRGPIKLEELVRVTHEVLSRYDALAALQHASKHSLVANAAQKRRGRPRLKRPQRSR